MKIRASLLRRCRAVLALVAAAALAGCSLAPDDGVQRLDRASGGDGQSLRLPKSWTSTGLPEGTRIVLPFQLPHRADSIAVYVAHTTLTYRATVNGRFVYASGGAASLPISTSSFRSASHFLLPDGLVHPGENELTLELIVPQRSYFKYLGVVYVGEADKIERLALRRWLAFHAGPMAIGVTLFAIGLVSLGLWAGRRDRDLFMLLSVGSLLWALQIFLYQWPTPLLPGIHWGVVTLVMYMWWPILLAVFFLRFAYRRSRVFELAAIVLVAVAAPVLYAGVHFDWGDKASIGLRLCVLIFVGIGLVAILRYAKELRTVTGYALFAAGLLGVGVAIFDFVRSLQPGVDRRLILNPYSGLSIVLFSGWMLLERYHKAFADFEMLNRDLEKRVDAANVELHRRLEQVEAARAAAEQANVAKSRFFAAASHDLRQPLHSLGLFATALKGMVANTEARDLVQRIGDSIGSLDRLFDELLDISRLDAGTVEVRPRNVALQPIFDRLGGEFFAEAAAKELRLRFHPTQLALLTDPMLLERVLANLVSNAIRYTRSGGVLVGARRRGAAVLVQVWDTGIGIEEDQQALIFDEFYQVGNPGRDRRRGLGLGLSIVRRLTTLLDHPLELRSKAGTGTCFTLTLPRASGPVEPLHDDLAEEATVFSGRAALVVDDDADICDATVKLLQAWGFDARAAPNYSAARALLLGGFAPDVMLADLRLGEIIDGVGVVERLRSQLGWSVPAVLISGDTGARELARVKGSGLLLLTKPVAPARLRSALHALLMPVAG